MNGNKRIFAIAAAAILMISGSTTSAAFISGRGGTSVSFSSVGNARAVNQVQSKFMGRGMKLQQRPSKNNVSKRRKGTELCMFADGGILGIGTPELAVILLVGYFVLGPTELFKLTKEIGKFIQNFRTLGTEATKTFESTMENQVELQELRNAQSELNEAFNFRRSINVDKQADAFSELPPIATEEIEAARVAAAGSAAAAATNATATAATTDAKPKRKKRRRVKKKVEPEDIVPPYSGDIPDLDMSSAFQDEFKEQMGVNQNVGPTVPPAAVPQGETEAEAAARVRKDRIERLEKATEKQTQPAEGTDWYNSSEADLASEVLAQQPTPEQTAAEQSRFAAQLSGNWNDQVVANEDKLSPLSKIMERISILEEERMAANRRLDEEFSRRAELEEKFYREKKYVLEEAANEVSASVYGDFDFGLEDASKEETKASPKEKSEEKQSKEAAPAVENKSDDVALAKEVELKNATVAVEDKPKEISTTVNSKETAKKD